MLTKYTTEIMLYFVGLGLGDAEDVTVKGLEVIKKADHVFLEAYTSILTCGKEQLEKFYGKPVKNPSLSFILLIFIH